MNKLPAPRRRRMIFTLVNFVDHFKLLGFYVHPTPQNGVRIDGESGLGVVEAVPLLQFNDRLEVDALSVVLKAYFNDRPTGHGTMWIPGAEAGRLYHEDVQVKMLEHLEAMYEAYPDDYRVIPSIADMTEFNGINVSGKTFYDNIESLVQKGLVAREDETPAANGWQRVFITDEGRWLLGKKPGLAEELRLADTDTLIGLGEGSYVEFKEAAHVGPFDNKPDGNLTNKVVRAVASFLNTRGGILLLGVADDRTIKGVEREFEAVNKRKRDWDGYVLFLRGGIGSALGEDCLPLLDIKAVQLDDHIICRIEVQHSATPRFFKGVLPVRDSAATQDLKERDMFSYIRRQWPSYNP